MDPGLGGADALSTHPSRALPGAGLPPLAGRARVLREPAAAGRASSRRCRGSSAPSSPTTSRSLGEPAALGPRRAAPRAPRERRPARRVRGGGVLRGGPAPLDAPVAPARAGDRLPAARAPRPRPLLGAPHAAPRARRRADARAAGALVDLPRRDHRRGARRGHAGGALRRAASPRELGRLAAALAAGGRDAVARDRALPAHAGVPGPGVHARDGRDLRGHAAVLRRRGHAGLGRLSQRLLDPTTMRDTLFPGPRRAGPRHRRARRRRRARYRAVAVAASAVAVVFSLGPETALYRFLHEHVVLVRGVRALSRFALVPTLALSVLAGLALAGRRRLVVLAALVADDARVGQPAAAARALRRAVARRRAGSPASRAPCWCCRSPRTTRSRCSTASRTAARS